MEEEEGGGGVHVGGGGEVPATASKEVKGELVPEVEEEGSGWKGPDEEIVDPLLKGFFSEGMIQRIASVVDGKQLNEETLRVLAPDVEYRVRELMQQAIKFMYHARRTKLRTSDVSAALRAMNVDSLYGYSMERPLQFQMSAGSSVCTVEDKEVDFADVIMAKLPPAPRRVSLQCHWLAVEGVQPAVQQNPTVVSEVGTPSSSSGVKRGRGGPSDGGGAGVRDVEAVLTKESRMYYNLVTSSLNGGRAENVDVTLQRLSRDAGVAPLLPYFVQYVRERLTTELTQLATVRVQLRVMEALLGNPHIFVDPYLYQLLPMVVTALVARRICSNPTENHWEVRRHAAQILCTLCRKAQDVYPNLQARVTTTLLGALLDLSKPLTTHFGAIVALTGLGRREVEAFLLPHLAEYMALLEPELESDHIFRKLEAAHVYEALLDAARVYLQDPSVPIPPVTYSMLHKIFGEKIEIYNPNPWIQLFVA